MQNTNKILIMKRKPLIILVLLSVIGIAGNLSAQHTSEDIRLNQIGFYPDAPKLAVVVKDVNGKFFVTTPDLTDTVYTGELKGPYKSDYSDRITQIADFSDFKKQGTYVISIPNIGYSYQFDIKPGLLENVAKGSLKSFYFQRASTPLQYEYAGIWARPAGHPDNHVIIHGSAASEDRPEGTIISCPRGWYDAGDYNLYIVNSGITMGILLSLYEEFPAYFKNIRTNIPESDNNIPDLLDEILWNLRWMLTMQDPADGGVYFKLTDPGFGGMVMPVESISDRYVVQKSTASALDFVAVMAQAARILKNFERELPGLSDSCLNAARYAWLWAEKNQKVIYDQRSINEKYDPDIRTGLYWDKDFDDEWIWAASELYLSTKTDYFYKAVKMFPDDSISIPYWGQVKLLGYFTLLRNKDLSQPVAGNDLQKMKKLIVDFADSLTAGISKQYYHTVIGQSSKDFTWGSNDKAATQGIVLIQAYKLTGNKKYVNCALSNLDYLLGRNATGYSFVTGYGDKTPLNLHHRPSAGDGIREPVPGILAGGPNAVKEDRMEYPSDNPDECYLDNVKSYASNENAINWNAALTYLAFTIDALQYEVGYTVKK